MQLLSAKILIIGLGGLGSPAALYLAGAGIGTLGFMDVDRVDTSNLHRQIAHTESAAHNGMSKVRSAAARCKELNSEIRYVCHEEAASAENLLDLVAPYDLVLDCTDNPATRYLISDVCVVLGKVLVSGAAQRGEGMLVVLNSPPRTDAKGPCYRCVFPRPPAPETVRGCSEIGILGPVVGTIGTLMAGEAIKIVARGGHLPPSATAVQVDGVSLREELTRPEKKQQPHTMLLYNTYAADPKNMFRTITLRGRRRDCIACGDEEALVLKGLSRITADVISQGRLDYQAFCGTVEDVELLGDERRIEAPEFLTAHSASEQVGKGRKRPRGIVVDVREEHEYELGAKVRGSVNIPISRILRHGGGAFDGLDLRVGPGEESCPGGGMIDQETHISGSKRDEASASDRPAQSGSREEGMITVNDEDSEPTPVYFVCQRGNDSQIAAQKLIEKIEADKAVGSESDETAKARSRWGWIGDVRGGFVAMERHASSS